MDIEGATLSSNNLLFPLPHLRIPKSVNFVVFAFMQCNVLTEQSVLLQSILKQWLLSASFTSVAVTPLVNLNQGEWLLGGGAQG